MWSLRMQYGSLSIGDCFLEAGVDQPGKGQPAPPPLLPHP